MRLFVEFFVNNGYTLELLLAFSMFSSFFKRRPHWQIRALVSYLILLGFSIFCWKIHILEYSWGPFVKYMTMYLIATAGAYVSVEVSTYSLLFIFVCASATQHLTFKLYSVILSLNGADYDSLLASFLNPLLVAAVYSVVFAVFYSRFRNINEEKFSSPGNVALGVAVFLITLVVHLVTEDLDFMLDEPLIFVLFSIYDMLCCLLALSLQYSVIESKKLLDDNETLEYLVYKQNENYETLRQNIDLINIKCHDMKQQISMYGHRMDPEALEEIKGIIRVFDTPFETGNDVLDTFFAEKSLILEQKKIKLNCIADGTCLTFMKAPDLYNLFGNAFDNAVEALEKVEEERRLLTISVKRRLNLVIIHFENYYQEPLQLEDDLPATTKDNRDYHGFGMRSIRLIAEKYKGTMSFEARDEVFSLNVLLPAESV